MKNRSCLLKQLSLGMALAGLLGVSGAAAEGKYSPGASDTEIRIGQTMPYSGPASALSTMGRLHTAYFNMINEQGGINGRKISFTSLDDGFSPPKAVEQTRKLVEQDKVLLIFSPYGTATSSAVRKYLNKKEVPQLFVVAGGAMWGDHENYPWTMGWMPRYGIESRIHADFILKNKPDGKIAVLYQNDDFGKELLQGLREGLGDKASMIVQEQSYEVTDATVNSQIAALKESGADILLSYSYPRFTAQVIRRIAEMGWQPLHIVNQTSTGVANVLTPAGLDNAKGLYTAHYVKDPTDPAWKDDKATADWRAWMAKYYPEGDINDISNLFAYALAKSMVDVLERCGDDLTNENVMKQAASLDMEIGVLVPGIRVKTAPDDFYPVKQMQLMNFDGKSWHLVGDISDGSALK